MSTALPSSTLNSVKMTMDEKRRTACWRLIVKGAVALRSLLMYLVQQQLGETWIDWCKASTGIVKDRVSYNNSKRLEDAPDVPDPEAMDITYLAHILGNLSLVDDEMKDHIKVVKDVRNDLCRKFTEAMDEAPFEETCDSLITAFEKIIAPSVKDRQRRQFLKELESLADPAAIDSITEAELRECKAQIEELKQQLKDASSNNNFDQSLTYEDTKIKGNHTLTVAHLKGKVESEDIVAAGRAMGGTTQNATYRRVSMENHTVAGMVIEK